MILFNIRNLGIKVKFYDIKWFDVKLQVFEDFMVILVNIFYMKMLTIIWRNLVEKKIMKMFIWPFQYKNRSQQVVLLNNLSLTVWL